MAAGVAAEGERASYLVEEIERAGLESAGGRKIGVGERVHQCLPQSRRMPARRMAGEERGARGGWIEQSGDVGHEPHEVAVDGKGLPLRPVAPRWRIEHDAGKLPPAAEAARYERGRILADPRDRQVVEARGHGVATGERHRLPRSVDVHDFGAGGSGGEARSA